MQKDTTSNKGSGDEEVRTRNVSTGRDFGATRKTDSSRDRESKEEGSLSTFRNTAYKAQGKPSRKDRDDEKEGGTNTRQNRFNTGREGKPAVDLLEKRGMSVIKPSPSPDPRKASAPLEMNLQLHPTLNPSDSSGSLGFILNPTKKVRLDKTGQEQQAGSGLEEEEEEVEEQGQSGTTEEVIIAGPPINNEMKEDSRILSEDGPGVGVEAGSMSVANKESSDPVEEIVMNKNQLIKKGDFGRSDVSSASGRIILPALNSNVGLMHYLDTGSTDVRHIERLKNESALASQWDSTISLNTMAEIRTSWDSLNATSPNNLFMNIVSWLVRVIDTLPPCANLLDEKAQQVSTDLEAYLGFLRRRQEVDFPISSVVNPDFNMLNRLQSRKTLLIRSYAVKEEICNVLKHIFTTMCTTRKYINFVRVSPSRELEPAKFPAFIPNSQQVPINDTAVKDFLNTYTKGTVPLNQEEKWRSEGHFITGDEAPYILHSEVVKDFIAKTRFNNDKDPKFLYASKNGALICGEGRVDVVRTLLTKNPELVGCSGTTEQGLQLMQKDIHAGDPNIYHFCQQVFVRVYYNNNKNQKNLLLQPQTQSQGVKKLRLGTKFTSEFGNNVLPLKFLTEEPIFSSLSISEDVLTYHADCNVEANLMSVEKNSSALLNKLLNLDTSVDPASLRVKADLYIQNLEPDDDISIYLTYKNLEAPIEFLTIITILNLLRAKVVQAKKSQLDYLQKQAENGDFVSKQIFDYYTTYKANNGMQGGSQKSFLASQ